MQDSSLEKQMQQLMSGLEYEPDAAVWEKIRKEIGPEKKRRGAMWRWLSAAGILMAVSAGVVWYYTTSSPSGIVADSIVLHKPASVLADTVTPLTGDKTAFVRTDSARGSDQHIMNPVTGTASVPATAFATNDLTRHTTTNNHSITGMPVTEVGAASDDHLYNKPAKQPLVLEGNTLPITSATSSKQAISVMTTDSITATAVMKDRNIAIVVQAMNPLLLQSNPFMPVTGIVAPVIVPAKIKSEWIAEPFVRVGLATSSTGIAAADQESSQSMDKSYFLVPPDYTGFYSGVTGPGSGTGTVGQVTKTSYSTTTRPDLAFAAGIRGYKQIARRWTTGVGIQYEYLSYNTIITTHVQNVPLQNNSADLYTYSVSEKVRYQLHYIGIPLTMRYQLLKSLGVSAGIINDVCVSGRQGKLEIGKDLRWYVPSAYLSFDMALPVKKQVLYITPYVQYGLLSPYKTILQDKRTWQTGLQFSARF